MTLKTENFSAAQDKKFLNVQYFINEYKLVKLTQGTCNYFVHMCLSKLLMQTIWKTGGTKYIPRYITNS